MSQAELGSERHAPIGLLRFSSVAALLAAEFQLNSACVSTDAMHQELCQSPNAELWLEDDHCLCNPLLSTGRLLPIPKRPLCSCKRFTTWAWEEITCRMPALTPASGRGDDLLSDFGPFLETSHLGLAQAGVHRAVTDSIGHQDALVVFALGCSRLWPALRPAPF